MQTITNDLIIIISGSSGVGKTTIAKQLLKESPDSFIIEEWDLIREALRINNSYVFNAISHIFSGQIDNLDVKLENILHCNILNRSTSELTLDEILEQSKMFIRPLISICRRIQMKRLSVIIEGVNLPIKLLVSQKDTANFFSKSKNIVLVNLYAANYKIYKERLDSRAAQRNLPRISNTQFRNIKEYNEYNSNLFTNGFNKTNELKNIIINIDVTSHDFTNANDIAKFILRNINNLVK